MGVFLFVLNLCHVLFYVCSAGDCVNECLLVMVRLMPSPYNV